MLNIIILHCTIKRITNTPSGTSSAGNSPYAAGNFMNYTRRLALTYVVLLALTARLALAEEPFRVGVIFSLTGWGADGGSPEFNGVLLAREEINATGGIAGHPVELITEDNRSDLTATATAFKKLTSIDKVAAILGPNWGTFIGTVAPLANAEKLPLLSFSGFKENSFVKGGWAFTLWPPPEVATVSLSTYIGKKKHSRVAFLVSENDYYQGLYQAMSKQLAALKVNVVAAENFNPGQYDYRSSISKLKSQNVDAVVALLLESGELSGFLKQRRDLKLEIPVYAANTIPFDKILQNDPAVAEGMIYFDYLPSGKDDFRAKYRTKFGQEPGLGSARAYDGLYLLKNAVEKCGAQREQIRQCLNASDYPGTSGRVIFDNRGVIATENTPITYLMQVHGGKFERVDG
jgi:branched-chain amino acid transport system substrate-binding protein